MLMTQMEELRRLITVLAGAQDAGLGNGMVFAAGSGRDSDE